MGVVRDPQHGPNEQLARQYPIKYLFPGVPDVGSLRGAREMGYKLTPIGLVWPEWNGKFTRPDGRKFPTPALIFLD